MIQSLGALVLVYNEAEMLRLTLPGLKASVDEVIVVDMGSTDGSLDICNEVLTQTDRVVSYPRQNLFAFGFAHPRNYGNLFARSEWMLAVDSDEMVEPDQVRALRSLDPGPTRAFTLTRRNYQAAEGLGLHDVDGLVAGAPFTTEEHPRLHLNAPTLRWEGVIHEEIWDGDVNAYATSGSVDVTLHHLNAFKSHLATHEKQELYSYLTLKAFLFPRFQHGANAFWFTTYVKDHFHALLAYANAFCDKQGLPRLDNIRLEEDFVALHAAL